MKTPIRWVLAGTLVLIAATAFSVVQNRAGERFATGTVIGGTDVSGMTARDLEEQIRTSYSLTVVYLDEDGEDKEETISGTDIDVSFGGNEAEVEKLLQEQGTWTYLIGQGKQYEVDNLLQYDEDKLEGAIESLACFDKSRFTEPENAYISDYDKEKGYEIVKETRGNILDRKKARMLITEAVDQMQGRVELFEEGCYKEAEITSENKELKKTLKQLNTYTATNITYDFGKKTEVIDGELVSKWLRVTKKGKVKLDANKVEKFVTRLRKKYDTIFTKRKLKTSYGKTITVSGGDYGWWMNCTAEKKALTKLIKAGKQTERTPVYYQTAKSYGKTDYGDSYIEINLTAQHVFVYVKGKKVLETDCVTGNSARGYDTPAGTYSITYTERNATLKGENYSTPVKYWMPFNRNIGLHDASWRSSFGGEIYKYNGSHGCVNLPPEKAEKLFRYVKKGMPVFCYHLAVPKKDKKAQAASAKTNTNKSSSSKKNADTSDSTSKSSKSNKASNANKKTNKNQSTKPNKKAKDKKKG